MKNLPQIILVTLLFASILGFIYPKENISPVKKPPLVEKEKNIKLQNKHDSEVNDTTDFKTKRREKLRKAFEQLDRYCHL